MTDKSLTVNQALRQATARLGATSDTARMDAEWLMAHALGVNRAEMLLRHGDASPPSAFDAMIERRLTHEPVQYIIGIAEFCGLELAVTPDVLIPRADSETLIDVARQAFATIPPAAILDLGTGSGCLLLAAAKLWPNARAIGIERSPEARAVARRNADVHAPHATITAGDWTAPDWTQSLGRFDLILANPPYVEADAKLDPSVRGHEPHGALFSGADGLDDYRALLPFIPALMAPSGLAIFEIGHTQAAAVTSLAKDIGLGATLHRDLAGRARALVLR